MNSLVWFEKERQRNIHLFLKFISVNVLGADILQMKLQKKALEKKRFKAKKSPANAELCVKNLEPFKSLSAAT